MDKFPNQRHRIAQIGNGDYSLDDLLGQGNRATNSPESNPPERRLMRPDRGSVSCEFHTKSLDIYYLSCNISEH